jgi:3-methyladenine DNA glycosylase/8-oxoguanine DNA glycosylase
MGERRVVRELDRFFYKLVNIPFYRFICSSNNNISRITKMVQSLCNHFSPPLLSLPDPCDPSQLHAYHPFPPPSTLSQSGVSATLRTLGFGYRAEFIPKTAKYLIDSHGSTTLEGDPREASERWLLGLRDRSTVEARGELLKLTGVGRKVADCVLLMSLDKVGCSFLLRLPFLSCSQFEQRKKSFLLIPMFTKLLSSTMA